MEILNNSINNILSLAAISTIILLFFLRSIYYTNKSASLKLFDYKINKTKFLIKNILFVIGFISLIMAYLGVLIDFSFVNKAGVPKDMIFILDTSKSMDTQDMGGANSSRIEYAKNMISNFVVKNVGNNYSLYIFAGKTENISPLTNDSNWFLTNLNSISTNSISTGGTKIKDAIDEVIGDFSKDNNPKNIILLSDGGDEGENNDIDSINIDANKIKIFTIGIGTIKGDYIPDGVDLFGNIRYKIYEGENIISKLNEDSLRLLAKKGNGEYILGDDKNILDNIKLKLIGNTSSKNNNSENDGTYLFVLIAFILFGLGYVIDYKNPIGKK